MVISNSSDSAYNSAAFMSYPSSITSSAQPQTHFHHPPHNPATHHRAHVYHPTAHNGVGTTSHSNARKYPSADTSAHIDWDINDTHVPPISPGGFNVFDEWVDGHQRCVYPADSEDARKHTSGWAMRNTNNHNVNILKKSCLGVLVCSLGCRTATGESVHLRPAICDKARRKQQGKLCPNRSCKGGRLEVRPCRGHCGYPVTHFWRHVSGGVFFQSKGVHDHLRPDAKNSAETRRALGIGRKKRAVTAPTNRPAKGEHKRNISTIKSSKKTERQAVQPPLQRPPPLIPDTSNDSPSLCVRCLHTNCACRLKSLAEPLTQWPPVRHPTQDHTYDRHKPLQSCEHAAGPTHHPQSPSYWMPGASTRPTHDNYQSSQSIPSHHPTGIPPVTQSHNSHPHPHTSTAHDFGQTNYHHFTPLTGDLFEPNHIFQLDQPIVRRSSGCANRSHAQPVTTQSPPTLLDLGSGAIEHKAFETFFETNEDSCTTGSSQNTDATDCAYTNAPFYGLAQPSGEPTPYAGARRAFNNPIVESGDILMEFETANDRFQRRKTECAMSGGPPLQTADLMVQGNLGIFFEREDEGGACYGRREVAPASGYGQTAYVSGGGYGQGDEQQEYMQYYRMNGNMGQNMNTGSVVYHS